MTDQLKARMKQGKRTVELRDWGELGYYVGFQDDAIGGSSYFIPTAKEAEQQFLWDVGYPLWREAADSAFRSARDKWLAAHKTLESVGADRWVKGNGR